MIKQLLQWPPTKTTVAGIAGLLGIASHYLTGDLQLSAAVSAAVAILLPEMEGKAL